MKSRIVLAVVAAAALTSGCGSSDDGPAATAPPPTATTDVPSSATQSVAGLFAYLTQLIGASSDTAEPLLVGTATLPVDETSEPLR